MKSIVNIKSQVTPYSSDIDVKAEITKYDYVLMIKTDGVSLVRGSDSPSLERLVELRAFDHEKELHIVKNGSSFIGRIREDGVGASTGCYDEQQLLWGKVIETDEVSAKLYDNRGICFSVPVAATEGDRVLLTVRSYLDDNCFEFVDYRLVDLSAAKVGEYNA